ncbi:MAG: hypothetical protein U1F37_17955 [Alphaproteobacteria bacterium]
MITLEGDRLVFRFPEVHADADCTIEFQRTLRIPDDGKAYPLPPGFGSFPLRHLDDFAARVPARWHERGGVIMPMHQAEAMWINFGGGPLAAHGYPCAVKVAAGKINAVTGDAWVNHLNRDPQDYVVAGRQPWLDGYCVEKGYVRQFVAMPLGEGYTAEEQITGAGEHGGVQIVVYPMKAERYEALKRAREAERRSMRSRFTGTPIPAAFDAMDMGLAPGGRMRQEIYDDPHGLDAWDQRHASRCFVTIANSLAWRAIAGELPPTVPPTAKDYSAAGLPWFLVLCRRREGARGRRKFAGLKSVAALGKDKNESPLPENDTAECQREVRLGEQRPVREMPA